MGERYLKVSFITPTKRPLAPFPFHRVGADSIYRSEAHLVELALACHTFDVKSQSLAVFDALYTEVEPCMVVASGCIRQRVTGHIACKRVWLSTLRRITLSEVSRIKLTGNYDASG